MIITIPVFISCLGILFGIYTANIFLVIGCFIFNIIMCILADKFNLWGSNPSDKKSK